MQRKDVYDRINGLIISNLEKGIIPWKKSFHGDMPRNFISKRIYNGINFLILLTQDFASPFYLTFLQAKNKGGSIKKGSKGLPVIYYELKDFPTEDEPERKIPFIRLSTVFNLEQTSLYKEDNVPLDDESLSCEGLIKKLSIKPVIKNNFQGQPFYNLEKDFISIPTQKYFDTPSEYYASLFHEMIHWTGHNSRLSRDMSGKFGNDSYSFEELIAEIGASYLCGLTGIDTKTISNQSAYISNWLNKLKNDSTLIVKASSEAKKAVNFFLGGV